MVVIKITPITIMLAYRDYPEELFHGTDHCCLQIMIGGLLGKFVDLSEDSATFGFKNYISD